MEIRVHTDSGEIFRFEQENELEAGAMLSSFHPSNLFTRQQIVIQGVTSTSGFGCHFVEYIEFVTSRNPGWKLAQGIQYLATIPREEFAERSPAYRARERVYETYKPGMIYEGLSEFVLRSGQRLFFEVKYEVGARLDQRLLIQNFLNPAGMFSHRYGGGYLILNPANIVRWVMYPRMPQSPGSAWYMRRIG